MKMMKKIWTLAALATLILVGLAGPSVANDHAQSCTPPTGTWTMKTDFDFITDPSDPNNTVKLYLQVLQFFTADGQTTLLLPTGEGHPSAGDTRIGCMGEWRWSRADHRSCEFEIIQHCLYNQAWDNTYGEILGKGSVSKNGRNLTFKFSYIDYNADGTLNYNEGTGVSYGARLVFPDKN
jgi:hypothetical protein